MPGTQKMMIPAELYNIILHVTVIRDCFSQITNS